METAYFTRYHNQEVPSLNPFHRVNRKHVLNCISYNEPRSAVIILFFKFNRQGIRDLELSKSVTVILLNDRI
jgi:hypothetical protein